MIFFSISVKDLGKKLITVEKLPLKLRPK